MPEKLMNYKINDYLTIKEAAAFLGVSENTLRNWEQAGKIIVDRHPINSYRLYRKEYLENLLNTIQPKNRLTTEKNQSKLGQN